MTAIEKIKKITAENGYTMLDVIGNSSVAFLAKLPESAVVDSVKVNGEYLEDIFDIDKGEAPPRVVYPREKTFDGYRVAAVITVEEGKGGKNLHQLASVGSVNEFYVHYHDAVYMQTE